MGWGVIGKDRGDNKREGEGRVVICSGGGWG